jgi:hypothetical protein
MKGITKKEGWLNRDAVDLRSGLSLPGRTRDILNLVLRGFPHFPFLALYDTVSIQGGIRKHFQLCTEIIKEVGK